MPETVIGLVTRDPGPGERIRMASSGRGGSGVGRASVGVAGGSSVSEGCGRGESVGRGVGESEGAGDADGGAVGSAATVRATAVPIVSEGSGVGSGVGSLSAKKEHAARVSPSEGMRRFFKGPKGGYSTLPASRSRGG